MCHFHGMSGSMKWALSVIVHHLWNVLSREAHMKVAHGPNESTVYCPAVHFKGSQG